MIKSVSTRFTNMQRIWKTNFALFLLLVLAIGMMPSFAGDPGSLQPGSCKAKIALVLDRSASIGVGDFGGNQDNVNAVKFGAGALVASMKAPEAFTDVYAFASDAQRINSAWLNLVDDNHVNLQAAAIAQIPFKTGQHNTDSGDLYPDGLAAGSEALTNWEAALRLPLVSHNPSAGDPLPDAIIIFTDGEPTTNIAETRAAQAAGGTYAAAGNPNVDGTDPDDLSAGYNMANYARSIGVRVIPVAIGDFSGANLDHMKTLAGPETLYTSKNFSDLANLLKGAVADVCQSPAKPTNVHISGVEVGADNVVKPIALPIVLDGALSGTLTTNPAGGWETRQFNATGNWDLRMIAQIPPGYHPYGERCERDKWTGQPPFLTEAEDSAGLNGHILLRGQAAGGDTYCEFAIQKNPVVPNSTLQLIGTDKDTGAQINAKFNYSNSPFSGPVFVSAPGKGFDAKTAQPANPWNFNTSWDTTSSPGYAFDSVYCRSGAWSPNSPVTGTASGVGIAGSGYAPGTIVTCEYLFKKIPVGKAALSIVKKVNGQDAPTSNPVSARVNDKLIYSFDIKNVGEIPVKDIKLSDPNLTSRRSDALETCLASLQGRTLAVNETFTCNAKEVSVPVDASGVIRNVASTSGTGVVLPGQTAPKTPEVSDDANVKIIKPIVSIEKKVNPSVVSYDGQTVTYTITAKNTGDASYEGSIVDVLLGVNKNVSIAPGNSVTITLVGKFNAASKTITFLQTQNPDLSSNKTVSISSNTLMNTACLANINLCANAELKVADLSIVKTALPTSLSINENGKYVIAVKNTGAVALNNVSIKDDSLKALFASANDGVNNNVKTTYAISDSGVNCDNGNDATLQVGETCTVNINYTMTDKLYKAIKGNGTANTVSFTNVAVANATVPSDGTVITRQDDATITVTATPSLTIDKKVSSNIVSKAGDSVTYTITVKNNGTGDATNVTVYEKGLGVNFGPFNIEAGKQVVITIVATFDGDNTLTFTRDGQNVTTKPFTNSVFKNIACLSPTGNDCSPEITVYKPGIKLDKTVKGSTSINIGDTITYQFQITNLNVIPVKDLVVTDATIKDLFGLSSVPTINIPNSKLGSDGVLTQGEKSEIVEFTTPVVTAEIGAKFVNQKFVNIAIANGTAVLPDGSTKPVGPSQDDAVVNLNYRTAWTFNKVADNHVARPGDTINYTFTVKNTGEAPIPSVTVTDNTINKSVVIAGPIAPGATATGSTTYVLPANYTGTNFVNTASACITGTTDCKPGTDTVKIPKIQLEKSGPASAFPGDEVTYKFVVKNIGETDLTNMVINDATLSTLLSKEAKINVPGILKPGASSAVIEYKAVIPASFTGKSFKNIAIVTGVPINPDTNQPEPNKPVTDDDDHTILLAKWHATKVADKTAVKPGETINYIISVFNDSDVALVGVQVSDPTIGFPSNSTPISVDIPAGAKVEVPASYTVPANYTGASFKNVALVCVPRTGETPDCEKPTVDVPVVRINVVKKADVVQAIVGDAVSFSFDVTNNSIVDLTNVRVVDAKVNFDQVIDSLKAGETKTVVATNKYTVTQGDLTAGKFTNIVSVCAVIPGRTGDCTPPPACEEGDEECTPPTGKCVETANTVCDDDTIDIPVVKPEIQIVKTADKQSAAVGETVNYTFVITNTGKVDLKDIKVTDNVLGDLGSIAELKIGASATKTVAYVVPVNTTGNIRNVATACFSTPVYKDNCASDDHDLIVVAGKVVERPGVLPFTGSPAERIVKAVLWLMLLGSGFILITRRKPRKA